MHKAEQISVTAMACPPPSGQHERDFEVYIAQHRLGAVIDSLLTAIIVDRPASVLPFLRDHVQRLQDMHPDEIEW